VLFAAVRELRGVVDPVPLTPGERVLAEARRPAVTVAALLEPTFADDWVALADIVLRGSDDPRGATQRARLASLRGLAAFAEAEVPAHRHPKPELRPLLSEPQIESALRALAGPLPGRGPDDHVRLAAVLAVMSVFPARSAELSALRLDQLSSRGSEVRLDLGDGEPRVLRPLAAERVRHWLEVRESLVSALQGGPVRALWTSIRSNSRPGGRAGSLPLPPGMPLKPRGLQRAYARSVETANVVHGGLPGFPLPRSLDLLRRSLENTSRGRPS
jgi:integrase